MRELPPIRPVRERYSALEREQGMLRSAAARCARLIANSTTSLAARLLCVGCRVFRRALSSKYGNPRGRRRRRRRSLQRDATVDQGALCGRPRRRPGDPGAVARQQDPRKCRRLDRAARRLPARGGRERRDRRSRHGDRCGGDPPTSRPTRDSAASAERFSSRSKPGRRSAAPASAVSRAPRARIASTAPQVTLRMESRPENSSWRRAIGWRRIWRLDHGQSLPPGQPHFRWISASPTSPPCRRNSRGPASGRSSSAVAGARSAITGPGPC